MRIIHTSDWHIGRTLGGYSLLKDQAYFLKQLSDFIKSENVDLLLISGDLYHYALPSSESVQLVNRFLTHIIQETGVKVFIIAGNHDQPERLEFGKDLLKDAGLYIQGSFDKGVQTVYLQEGDFSVGITMLPYFQPSTAREHFHNPEIRLFQDAAQAFCNQIKERQKKADRRILMAHGFFWSVSESGRAIFSESERSIGQADLVDVSLFDDFDYIALGHLHAPQRVKEGVYYSGSPLKYSVQEAGNDKSIQLIDISKEKISVKPVSLKPLHDVRVVSGSFQELMAERSEDYIFFELKDSSYVLGAMSQLKKHYPNVLGIQYTEISRSKAPGRIEKQAFLSPDKLFESFYKKTQGEDMSEEELKLLRSIIKEASSETE